MTDIIVIRVTVRSQYGSEVYYPANEQAEALARIAGTKTLTRHALTEARRIGMLVDYIDPNKEARP